MVYIASVRDIGETRTCALFVDNKAAVDALAKGSTSSVLGTIPVNLFWTAAVRGGARWRNECVNTTSNISDGPPRLCTSSGENVRMASDGRAPVMFNATFETCGIIHRGETLF